MAAKGGCIDFMFLAPPPPPIRLLDPLLYAQCVEQGSHVWTLSKNRSSDFDKYLAANISENLIK